MTKPRTAGAGLSLNMMRRDSEISHRDGAKKFESYAIRTSKNIMDLDRRFNKMYGPATEMSETARSFQ